MRTPLYVACLAATGGSLAGAQTPNAYGRGVGYAWRLVVLVPQKSVGRHSTGQNEEVLIVLEGHGEMLFGNGHTLPVEANHAVYYPPRTAHDVKNTGRGDLRYV